jgi:hypothetical protein
MQLDNKDFFVGARLVLITFTVLLIAGLILPEIPGSIGNLFDSYYLCYTSGAGILLLALFGFHYFSYEDEYEIVHVKTQSLVFGPYESHTHKNYEFPKVILLDYKVIKSTFLNKKLIITVDSSSGGRKMRSFNLTFVSAEKVAKVKHSLDQILERNAKQKPFGS